MLFPLRQSEDSSQGHSISNSSGKVLQKVGERSVVVQDSGEEGVGTGKHTFWQKVAAGHRSMGLHQ